jgi:hypothetical protein
MVVVRFAALTTFTLSTLLLPAPLLSAEANEAVQAYNSVLPVIVVGVLRFGAAML